MKSIFSVLFLILFSSVLLSTEKIPVIKPIETSETADSQRFLQWVRRTPVQESWASMSGEMSHRRRSQSAIKIPVYMGAIFTSKRAYVQFSVGDKESYTVSQSYGEGNPKSQVTPNLPDSEQSLPHYGVKADDMTLSFIYWNLKNELEGESVKLQKCRILELLNPDDNETARVWIAVEHGFPIKVQWFKKGENERYRSLEITSFAKQDNHLWVPTEFTLEGPGWRTLLKFSERKAGLGKEGIPDDLFNENK